MKNEDNEEKIPVDDQVASAEEHKIYCSTCKMHVHLDCDRMFQEEEDDDELFEGF